MTMFLFLICLNNPAMSEIIVENLTKKYGNQTAIDGISFQVNKGEIVGFIGPNGAGKSTTMKIMTSYMAPSSGNIIIDGEKVGHFGHDIKSVKKGIGYLPENNPLYA